MKTSNNDSTKAVQFSDIAVGDCFCNRGTPFIKTVRSATRQCMAFNAVDLKTGFPQFFDDAQVVIYCPNACMYY